MDASSVEVLFHPSKCSKLGIDQKRELVYKLSKWSDGATEILHTWTHHDIVQILCAELGQEKKYSGLNKMKIIEHLLKIIHEKKKSKGQGGPNAPSSENYQRIPKRQRKSDSTTVNSTLASCPDVGPDDIIVSCKNTACRAKMGLGDVFCKRCSCCICRQYDDNKDPSRWLVCNSEFPFCSVSCGLSSHLECALWHENSKISVDRQDKGSSLDGSFCCASCGSWRKQLVVAKDRRRVDILCYRLCLSQKILDGTRLYHNLCASIDEAVKKLEQEVGLLTGLPAKMGHGIVSRLSPDPEIQRLCAAAVKLLDSMLSGRASDAPSDCTALSSKLIRIEDINTSSVTIVLSSDDQNTSTADGNTLWHQKIGDTNYPSQPTCRLFPESGKHLLSDLNADTNYFLKVVILNKGREFGPFKFQFRTENPKNEFRKLHSNCFKIKRSQSPATNCSSLSNPSSVEDESTNNILPCGPDDIYNKTDEPNLSITTSMNCSDNMHKEDQIRGMSKNDVVNGSNAPPAGLECIALKITHQKAENVKNVYSKKNMRKTGNKGLDEPHIGSTSEKRVENREREFKVAGDEDFEHCVKVIRHLEFEGHIETDFRMKFLTWYSLRATSRELQVVRVFIDTFIEEPESLAGQLVDAFLDVVSDKISSVVPAGLCPKLWH